MNTKYKNSYLSRWRLSNTMDHDIRISLCYLQPCQPHPSGDVVSCHLSIINIIACSLLLLCAVDFQTKPRGFCRRKDVDSDYGRTKERAYALVETVLLGEHIPHLLVCLVQKNRIPVPLRFCARRRDMRVWRGWWHIRSGQQEFYGDKFAFVVLQKEMEILLFLMIVVMIRTRKAGSVTMIAYLSSSFLYTKTTNLLLWFYADVRYGLFFTAIAIGM